MNKTALNSTHKRCIHVVLVDAEWNKVWRMGRKAIFAVDFRRVGGGFGGAGWLLVVAYSYKPGIWSYLKVFFARLNCARVFGVYDVCSNVRYKCCCRCVRP